MPVNVEGKENGRESFPVGRSTGVVCGRSSRGGGGVGVCVQRIDALCVPFHLRSITAHPHHAPIGCSSRE